MCDSTRFLTALRHFLPETEDFLFVTLEQETLSLEARITLNIIQNKLNLIKTESSLSQSSQKFVNFYFKSLLHQTPDINSSTSNSPVQDLYPIVDPLDLPISPPTAFQEDILSENEFELPLITSVVSLATQESEHSGQNPDFNLVFDSPSRNSPVNNTEVEGDTPINHELNSFLVNSDSTNGSGHLTKKRGTEIEEFISKKIKLTTDSPVLISDEETDYPCHTIGQSETCDATNSIVPIGTETTDLISPDSLAEYDLQFFEDFEGLNQQREVSPQHNLTHSSSSSSSISSCSSSSRSSSDPTPDRELPEDEHPNDVISLHVSPDDAFPSSVENNTPDTEADTSKVAQVVEVADVVEVAEVAQVKLPAKSRLGTRVKPPEDTFEIPHPLKLKPRYDKIIQYYSERPIECNDCHSAMPLVTSEQYQCNHCFCKYKQNEFETHVTPDRDTPKCPFCFVTFKTECELNIHKTNKHPKINLCENCIISRKQKSESQLVPVLSSGSNLPKHTVDGSYVCQDCCMRFKTKLDLTNHSEMLHSTTNSSPLVPEVQIPSLPDRVPSHPTPSVTRSSGQELDPNCDLQLSKNAALRDFEFLRNKQNL